MCYALIIINVHTSYYSVLIYSIIVFQLIIQKIGAKENAVAGSVGLPKLSAMIGPSGASDTGLTCQVVFSLSQCGGS